jgi:copper(I)-binding protein
MGEKVKMMMKLLFGWALMAATMLATADPVSASGAWIRLLPGSLPGAGYVELRNEGKEPVALVGVKSPAFSDIEVHRSFEDGGVARMEHIERLELPPGETVVLGPSGYHLMMFERRPGLKLGERVPVSLHFSNGDHLDLEFPLARERP